MSNMKAKSLRGEMVDFSLIMAKNELTASPIPLSVSNRELFIDSRKKRVAVNNSVNNVLKNRRKNNDTIDVTNNTISPISIPNVDSTIVGETEVLDDSTINDDVNKIRKRK